VPVYELRSGSAAEADYTPYGAVRDAMLCHEPEILVTGPADTGKSLGMLWMLHITAIKYPNASLVIARKTLTSTYATILQTYLHKVLRSEDLESGFVSIYGNNKPEWFDYANGSRIWVSGLDKPEKILSAEHDIVYVAQAEEITLSDWEVLSTRVTGRAGHIPFPRLVGDCNPSGQTHWILQRNKTGHLTLFWSTHKDNPELYDPVTGEVTLEGEKRLARLRRLTGHRLKRLYYGIWAPPEGAIFEMYDEETHKVKAFKIPQLWPRFVGVDPFGAKIAAVWVAYDPQGMALHVYREYVQPFGITTGEHVKQILDLAGYSETGSPTHRAEQIFAWVGGGPSERQARLDFTGFGLPLVPSPVKDVWAGIGRIASLMREGRLFIHDCCVNLLSEIGDYRRKQNKKTGEFTDTIENKDAYHAIDSLRYVLSYLTGSGEETQDEIVDYSIPIGPRL